MYEDNNGTKKVEIKKQSIFPNKPINQIKQPNYANYNANNNIMYTEEKRPAPPTNISEKDRNIKIDSNLKKNIDLGKNLGSNKLIENKNIHLVKSANEYRPFVNQPDTRKEVSTKGMISFGNTKS